MSLCCINLFFGGPTIIASCCQSWGQRGDGSSDPWSILHLWLHQPALPGAHTIRTKVIFISLKYFIFILQNMFVFQENIHRGLLSDNSSKKAGMGSGAGVLFLWWAAQHFSIQVYKCILTPFSFLRWGHGDCGSCDIKRWRTPPSKICRSFSSQKGEDCRGSTLLTLWF